MDSDQEAVGRSGTARRRAVAEGTRPLPHGALVALWLGLLVANLDLAVAAVRDGFKVQSLTVLLGPPALLFGAIAMAHLALCVITGPLVRRARLQPERAAAALAAGLATPVGLAVLARSSVRDASPFPFSLVVSLAIGAMAALLAYLAAEAAVRQPRLPAVGLRMLLVVPVLLFALFALEWIRHASGAARGARSFLIAMAIAMGALSVILRLLLPRGREAHATGVLLAIAALLVALPVASHVLGPRSLRPVTRARATSSDNPVRHVVLLTIDALRGDALSCYGGAASTPNIDALAGDGIRFTAAHSTGSWTMPAIASIMTGLTPFAHAVKHMGDGLPPGVPTLAERLRAAGYRTAGIGFNYFLTPRGSKGTMARGFDHYDFYPKSHRPRTLAMDAIQRVWPGAFGQGASTEELTRLAEGWIGAHKRDDFFLWLHYFDPHIPYAPPAGYFPEGEPHPAIGREFDEMDDIRLGKLVPSPDMVTWIRALYDAEVRYVDGNVGRLLSALKSQGLYDDALIILTTDHGDEHYEHRGIDHGHSLYEELLWIPLIIKLPGSRPAGTIERAVATDSILPTILELCEIRYDQQALLGRSLVPFWQAGGGELPDREVYATGLLFYEERESVLFDGLKYIRFESGGRDELYDLRHDPGERKDIAAVARERVQRGRSLLRRHRAVADQARRAHGLRGPEPFALDEEDRRTLRSLGYVN